MLATCADRQRRPRNRQGLLSIARQSEAEPGNTAASAHGAFENSGLEFRVNSTLMLLQCGSKCSERLQAKVGSGESPQRSASRHPRAWASGALLHFSLHIVAV